MRHNPLKRALTLLVAASLGACTTSTGVHTAFEPGVDLTDVITFAWISDKPLHVGVVVPVSPAFETALKNAARRHLAVRGYRFVDNPVDADLLMAFSLGTRTGAHITRFPDEEAAEGGWVWGGPRWQPADVRDSAQATLGIDLFRTGSRRGVWHGWTTREISDAERQVPGPAVDAAVGAILAEFPP